MPEGPANGPSMPVGPEAVVEPLMPEGPNVPSMPVRPEPVVELPMPEGPAPVDQPPMLEMP